MSKKPRKRIKHNPTKRRRVRKPTGGAGEPQWQSHFCWWPVTLYDRSVNPPKRKTFWMRFIEKLVVRDCSRLSSAFDPETTIYYRA